MTSIQASVRKERGRKTRLLRLAGQVPAVLYGPKTKSQMIVIQEKEFERAYRQAGESTLLSLEVGDKKIPVLIHDIQRDPLQGSITHVDFYEPPLDKKVRVELPIVVKGTAPAVKELGGTLIKHIQELAVSALPQNLPHELAVSGETLVTFEDRILVKDLKVPEGVDIIDRDPNEVICQVVQALDVEKELATPVKEAVEEVEKVEKEKKEKPEEELQEEPKPEE